ncbi:hypothetical protein QN224_29395 [Sinorhizobium sp. 8-89]|uniref:hypothetical protein n=1 Tax=Sinorhizobium sp. 7-81 TaxID=3049087 RepID=UPI0024C3E593|nr:hypothetical protein [Sinorhizobium sp. 7-81]MDK1389503.1 hypothetical protein [Sinorhizobium sp. 7-81]
MVQSYPSDHPAFGRVYPEMTVSDWGCSVASIAAEVIRRESLTPHVLLVGWSMAGRMSQSFNRSATAIGLRVLGFISLAANAPLPGLAPISDDRISLTRDSLWTVTECAPNGIPYYQRWTDELTQIMGSTEQALFTEEICRHHYFANCPINLRGEATRFRNGKLANAINDAIADLGSLDFADYPLTASIVPTLPSDAKHALTDQAAFAFFNSRRIYHGLPPGILKEISPDEWDELRSLMQDLPRRLTRFQDGGHFFFVGEAGAAATSAHIGELLNELEAVASLLRKISDAEGRAD